ncbi:MAG: 3-hydroxyacyl-CoA dehydrogenase NAD-binding domain-containing protein [Gammaproteobacteria bacterium]|nr:3-hydroxyacyl-CoA dehydrogenase NAD-binding domain-containing protein [Gammaproteobacteria bacterium]
MILGLQHWHYHIDHDNIAWATFSKKDTAINTLDYETLAELKKIIDATENSHSIALVILSGKESGFIAGADIEQFQRCQNAEEGLRLILFGQEVFSALEKMKKPTLALIEGSCMGGGMELTLACRYRVACDVDSTQIGLPEIKLGIHPGWGGSIRLPRLIGAFQALPLMLSGKSLSARECLRLGIVHYALPKRECHHAVRSILTRSEHYVLRQSIFSRLFKKFSNMTGMRVLIARFLRRQVSKKTVMQHYPALDALISQWEKHGVSEEAYGYEAASLVSLFPTETSQNLIRLFFLQTRMKNLAKGSAPIYHVHVIGAGTMGGDIAAWCALQGIKVTLQDREVSFIAPAIARAQRLFAKKCRLKHLIQAANDRLIVDVSGDGVSQADLIIEAIYENLEAKQLLLKNIEQRAKSTAIFATNTSSIALDELNTALKDPSRLVGVHFFNPVSMMQLIEVVCTEKTEASVLARALGFVKQIKRLPLIVKSRPGFLVNRILMPYLMESVQLVEEGVSIEQIDRAAVKFGMPMGPIELADTVGLDICFSVAQELTQHMGGTVPEVLHNKVLQKQLGKKTSQGFYTYKQSKKQRVKTFGVPPLYIDDSDIADRLFYRLLNESLSCLSEGIVSDPDMLDAGIVFGTGFAPFRGGPIQYAKRLGFEKVRERFSYLEQKYGKRFAMHAYSREIV